jgi:hypothetical protein
MSEVTTRDAAVVDPDAVVADTLATSHTASDMDLYQSKVDGLRVALQDCDADAAECERNLVGWQQRKDAIIARRVQVVRQLQAARVGLRALEDAADGV